MQRSVITFLSILLAASTPALAQTLPTATATTLSITSGGSPVATVSAGNVVTLTASVSAGSGAPTHGQVNFCDASANACTDIRLLGMAQITNAGTATLKFRPGVGNHSYKAVFLGTKSYSGSSSTVGSLAVNGGIGPFSTSTAISQSGSLGNYSLTATVTAAAGIGPPTGTASFLDTSNGNSILATAPLGVGIAPANLVPQQLLTTATNTPYGWTGYTLAGDFNGDGIPDAAVSTQSTVDSRTKCNIFDVSWELPELNEVELTFWEEELSRSFPVERFSRSGVQ